MLHDPFAETARRHPLIPPAVSTVAPQRRVLLKWLNVGTRKQRHAIAQGLSFLTPKIFSKFEQGHPQRGRQMQVG